MASTTQKLTYEVTCITLAYGSYGFEAITHLGINGRQWTKAEVIAALESAYPQYTFYTSVNGQVAILIVVDGPRGKYVRTWADGSPNNNLLELPRC